MTRVLFVVKARGNYDYGDEYSSSGPGKPSGLSNSAHFTARALTKYLGIDTKVAQVLDNNSIYKEINKYKPTHVTIEALWVVPSKFYELIPLYPDIKWIVRIHSKEVFLANEGIAIEWIRAYQKIHELYPNFIVSFNNHETNENFKRIGIEDVYLPNIYMPKNYGFEKSHPSYHHVNIGCFGAIRPMKNQLSQAIAAIEYANHIGKKLNFHINSSRVEQKGDVILKNLRALFFMRQDGHKLVEHGWMPHEEFCKIISQMDLGMQVSLSESFNIVSADFVQMGVPIVVSEDIHWMPAFCKADTTDVSSMVSRLRFAGRFKKIVTFFSKISLSKHNVKALIEWERYFNRDRN